MLLSKLENIVDSAHSYDWINPRLIKGFIPDQVKARNKDNWFCNLGIEESEEGIDEIITDYLYECLLENENKIRPVIEGTMLIDAAIYLIDDLGSSYAGGILSSFRGLVDVTNASKCLTLLMNVHGKTDSFVNDIMRDFILDMFRYGPLWDPHEGMFSHVLSDDQNHFLKEVFVNGYSTINNVDARFFSDGTKRC